MLVEELGPVEPLLLGLGLVHPRHDEELVADGAVELDGLLELVALNGVVRRVRAAGDEAVVIEQLAQFLGAAAVIAGELDALVADLRHRGQRAGQVGLALLAHRVELQADGNLPAGGGLGQGRDAEAEGDPGGADGGQELATGDAGG